MVLVCFDKIQIKIKMLYSFMENWISLIYIVLVRPTALECIDRINFSFDVNPVLKRINTILETRKYVLIILKCTKLLFNVNKSWILVPPYTTDNAIQFIYSTLISSSIFCLCSLSEIKTVLCEENYIYSISQAELR